MATKKKAAPKKSKPKEETREERDARIQKSRRAEAAATARNISPQAGTELDDDK